MDNFKINLASSKTTFGNGQQNSSVTNSNNNSYSVFSNVNLSDKGSFFESSDDVPNTQKTPTSSNSSDNSTSTKKGSKSARVQDISKLYEVYDKLKVLFVKKNKLASCNAFKTNTIEPMERELKGATIDYGNYSKLYDAQVLVVKKLPSLDKINKQLENCPKEDTEQLSKLNELKNKVIEANDKLEKYQTKRDETKAKMEELTPKLETAREEYEDRMLELDGATDESLAKDIGTFNNQRIELEKQVDNTVHNFYLFESSDYDFTKTIANNDGTVTSRVNTYNDVIYETTTDSSGRIINSKIDENGTAYNSDTSFQYLRNGSKIETTRTAGRTVIKRFDKDGNLTKIDYQAKEVDADGVIGDTEQGLIGDCWLIAGVNGLRQTDIGSKALNDCIQKNPGGSVTVHLKGAGKSYTFNPDEIAAMEYNNRKNKYSTGDTDMNLIEKAMERLRLDQHADGTLPEYKNDFDARDPLGGGFEREVVKALLPKSQYSIVTYMNKDKPYTLLNYNNTSDMTPDKMIEDLKTSSDNKAFYVSFINADPDLGFSTVENGSGEREQGKPLIVSGHAYHVSRVDDEFVYVVNPWNSSEYEIPYPKEKFLQNVRLAELFSLNK